MEPGTIPESGLVTSLSKERTAARAFVLRVKAGPDRGAQLSLGARAVVIGTHHDCDLVLSDKKVSRTHVELRAAGGTIEVRDLDSTNGTHVEGVQVKQGVAKPGATIRCGDTVLTVSTLAPPLVTPSARERFGAVVGQSLAMREIFAVLELASPSDSTVLIQGESGAGKEVVARAIHDHSRRAAKPLVIVDCAGSPEDLIESQLFGHVRGAFTGAVADRKGAFVEAAGGTVFLDEIGELAPPGQARLLRVLESRTVQPVGSDKTLKVDVRLIAATHRDLLSLVEEEKFRFDLFHRLAVVHVLVPPLRDRLDDLPLLVRSFFEWRGIDPGPIEGENLALLRDHQWRGNVRELRNVLERSWLLTQLDAPTFSELKIWLEPGGEPPFAAIDLGAPFKDAKERWVAAFERRYIAGVYARFGGNLTRAAEHAGLSRVHFRALLDEHGLREK